jgi:Na+/phosphate symporter
MCRFLEWVFLEIPLFFTCAYKVSVALVFRLDEVRQKILVIPSGSRPIVVIVSVASQVEHVVDVAAAPKTLTRVPYVHLRMSVQEAMLFVVHHCHCHC